MRSCRYPYLRPIPRSAFAGFRFPPEVITLAVRWYLQFGLSYRDVEELLAERGIEGLAHGASAGAKNLDNGYASETTAAQATVLTLDSPRGTASSGGVGLLDLLQLANGMVVKLGDQLLKLDVEGHQGS